MLVKVGMDGKLAASYNFIKSIAIEERIRDEIIDTRNGAKEFEKSDGIEIIEK